MYGITANRVTVALLITAIFAGTASANAGVPMIFITMPAMLIALVPIVFIEAQVIKTLLNLEYWHTFKIAGIANLASTILGIPLTWIALVGLEIGLGGGSAYGLDTIAGKFLAVTLQAPWLIPYEKDLGWMVPLAFLWLLIPFCYVSYLLEYYVARLFMRNSGIEPKLLKRVVLRANLISYSLLALICIGFFIVALIKR